MDFLAFVGCSDKVSVGRSILEGGFLVAEVSSPCMTHDIVHAACLELKFWSSPGNDHQMFVKRCRNGFEKNSKDIKLLWR
jgi:hypothetical protein